jgi:leader peptidase (prepilin peptidase)/N-methyltransferase
MNLLPVFVLGLIAGWLVNYLADVLPLTRQLSQPVCHHCGTKLSPGDYLLLRRCPHCGQRRSTRTYLTQTILLVGTFYLWFDPPRRLGFGFAYLLLIYLAIVFVIDWEHRLILHPVSLSGAILGLGIGWYAHGLSDTLLGGAVGFGSMFVLYVLGEVFARYMSRRRGEPIDEVALGFGDVNLAGVVGLLLGWPIIILGLLFAILAGGVASLGVILYMLIRKQYRAFTAIPYAPFLVLSVLLLLYR